MQELETLLNSMIKRGWKPWWIDSDTIYVHSTRDGKIILECPYLTKSYRDLISLESWLWQFVCDRSLLKSIWKARAKEPSISALGFKSEVLALSFEPEYRLLESALIPEEGLGKFLVDNIIVKWNSR